jgi:hypothetical protein
MSKTPNPILSTLEYKCMCPPRGTKNHMPTWTPWAIKIKSVLIRARLPKWAIYIDKNPDLLYIRTLWMARSHLDSWKFWYFTVCFQVSQWYDLVVFTASMEMYGTAVADILDNKRSILNRRYYRQVSRPTYPQDSLDLVTSIPSTKYCSCVNVKGWIKRSI